MELKATKVGDIEFIMTGDGVAMCDARKAGQTAIGFRVVDYDAMDPMNQRGTPTRTATPILVTCRV